VHDKLFLDLECDGLDPRKNSIHGIGVMVEEDSPLYYSVAQIPQWVIDMLANPECTVVLFSGRRFDIKFLHFAGFKVNAKIHDVNQIFKEIDENQKLDQKSLIEKYRGIEFLKNKKYLDQEIVKAGVKNLATFCALDMKLPDHPYFDTIAKYCKEDVENLFWLYNHGIQRLKEIRQNMREVFGNKVLDPINHLRNLVVPLEQVLFDMDKQGVKADLKLLDRIKLETEALKSGLLRKLYIINKEFIDAWEANAYQKVLFSKQTLVGKKKVEKRSKKHKTLFNWDATEHVGALIYEHYRLSEDLIKRSEKTGKYSLDKYQIMDLKVALGRVHPAYITLSLYEDYKKVTKVASTYTGTAKTGILSKIHDGRIWAEYTQTTKTWRLASRGPNLQNLPGDSIVHKFFIPDNPQKVFFVADYSQIELRLAAHLSQDKKLLEAYMNDEDIHAKTAAFMETTDRQVGKTANFLLIYRGSWRMLQIMTKRNIGIDLDEDECKYYVNRYFEEYEDLNNYLYDVERSMRRYRMVHCEETGAIRRLPDLVYGEHINWQKMEFTGPPELAKRAIDAVNNDWKNQNRRSKDSPPPPTKEQIFWKCWEFFRHAKKQGFNFRCQHMAMYICGLVMIKLNKLGYRIVSTVHDSLIIEIDKTELDKIPQIVDIMENTYKISVPLKVDWQLQTTFDKKDIYEG